MTNGIDQWWSATSAPYWTVAMMSKARNPDPITVTLTREEAEALDGCLSYPPIPHQPSYSPNEADRYCPACSGISKLRAALDSEARPTITEEAIERAARALLQEQSAQMGEGWEGDPDSEALADAVAQLEAALPALHEKWKAEAIERVKTMRYLNATGNVAWAYNGALDEAIRAIRGEPGE